MRAGRYKTALRITAAILLLATALVVVSALYSQGYRFSFKEWRTVYPGHITLIGVAPGDVIHLDGVRARPRLDGAAATLPVGAGEHTIVIDRPGSWPYAKSATVAESGATSIRPFFAAESPVATLVGTATPAYRTGIALIRERAASITTTPRTTQRSLDGAGYAVASVSGTTVSVEWHGPESSIPNWFCSDRCIQRVVVNDFKFPIDGLEFYPGRDDLLLVSVDGAIYIIEIDRRAVQNFQPVVALDVDALPFAIDTDSRSVLFMQDSTLLRIELP